MNYRFALALAIASAAVNGSVLAQLDVGVGDGTVALICGQTTNAGYRVRAMATQRLGTTLCSNDVHALCTFLSSRVSADTEVSTNALAGIKNDVLNALVAQQRLPDNLGQVLLDNYNDGWHDPVWRAFALQHILPYYRRRWLRAYPPLGGGASNLIGALLIEKAAMESNLWLAASGTNDDFCCIALRVLDGIIMSNGTVTTARVSAAAAAVANDESRSSGLRAHALEIASRHENKDVLATARKCAKASDSVLLRHTAIRALGLIGTAADEKLLEQLANSSDPVVRSVAADALALYLDRHHRPKPHKPGCPCSHCRALS